MALVANIAHITTKLHELKPALDASRGGSKCNDGASTNALGAAMGGLAVAFEDQGSMHTPTHQHTREERTIVLKKSTLWANVLGFFSQAPAHRQSLDTE